MLQISNLLILRAGGVRGYTAISRRDPGLPVVEWQVWREDRSYSNAQSSAQTCCALIWNYLKPEVLEIAILDLESRSIRPMILIFCVISDQYQWSLIFDLSRASIDLTVRSRSYVPLLILIFDLFLARRSKFMIFDLLVIKRSKIKVKFSNYDLDLWSLCWNYAKIKIKDQCQWSWSLIFHLI